MWSEDMIWVGIRKWIVVGQGWISTVDMIWVVKRIWMRVGILSITFATLLVTLLATLLATLVGLVS
jgi:hypothetical protein